MENEEYTKRLKEVLEGLCEDREISGRYGAAVSTAAVVLELRLLRKEVQELRSAISATKEDLSEELI